MRLWTWAETSGDDDVLDSKQAKGSGERIASCSLSSRYAHTVVCMYVCMYRMHHGRRVRKICFVGSSESSFTQGKLALSVGSR